MLRSKPVLIAVIALFVSLGAYGQQSCPNATRAAISFSSVTGYQQIVAATPGRAIIICRLSFNVDTAGAIKLAEGTGSNCGTGTSDWTGLYENSTGLSLQGEPRLIGSAGAAVCLSFSATVTGGGFVIYGYVPN